MSEEGRIIVWGSINAVINTVSCVCVCLCAIHHLRLITAKHVGDSVEIWIQVRNGRRWVEYCLHCNRNHAAIHVIDLSVKRQHLQDNMQSLARQKNIIVLHNRPCYSWVFLFHFWASLPRSGNALIKLSMGTKASRLPLGIALASKAQVDQLL